MGSAWIRNNGIYFQDFYGRLLMVVAVNVGPNWELPRLPSLRRHAFEPGQEGGGRGKRGAPRAANFVLPSHLLRREVLGKGALRGGTLRAREGRRPDRPERPRASFRGERRLASRGEKRMRPSRSGPGTDQGWVFAIWGRG